MRQALVVRGGWEGHAPVETTDLFLPFLRDQGFDVLVEDTLEVYADADTMDRTDLVLHSWTLGEILLDELRGLRDAVAAGTGLGGWHGGIVDAFRQSPEYAQLVGGTFVAHPGGVVPHTVDVVPGRADHPVVAGLASIPLRSEQYWVATDPLVDVLATTTLHPGAGDPWHEPVVCPAVWTRRWGAGRVFVSTPGHHTADLEVPAIRTIVERGLLWAARPRP
ncbi:ThuA domain-containing protein [Cellulomonas endophytica]|uniref:ThuA domain-containing protein n=1 Tax=Cellulomonas endophytica TaxID=2494735 RepID=UPI00196ADD51|nr:ThuA domain-containing protein [Cellulomonas endophytica]